MRPIRALVPAVALVLALSCSDEPAPAEVDAGTVEDAGLQPVVEDAGTNLDAGSDAGEGDLPKVHPPVSAADYCRKYAAAVCAREVRCAMLDAVHQPMCERAALKSCGEGYLSVGAAEGRLAFDEEAAGRCVGEIEDLGCHVTEEPESCGSVTAGLGVEASPCFQYGDRGNAECAAGFFCHKVEGQCPYQCVAYKKADEPCGTTAEQCDPNLDLSCDFDTRTCKPLGRDGAECFWSGDCASGYFCNENDLCAPEPPVAKAGEPCGTSGNFPACESGLYCRRPSFSEPGICTPQIAEGGTCTGYGQCQSPLYCSAGFSIGTCQKKREVGQRCDNYYGCRGSAWCDEDNTGTCVADPIAGESCEETYFCAEARCDFSQPPYTCVALLEDFEPCTSASQCESGRCGVPTVPQDPGGGADGGVEEDGGTGPTGPVCLPSCAP